MTILEDKSRNELLKSVVAELAKAGNEIKCAQIDITKAQSRLNFLLVVANELINRKD